MGARHTLKTNRGYFDAVAAGEKTFEVRRNDRGFQKGDVLVLLPEGWCDCGTSSCPKNADLPDPMVRRITYVFSGDPSLRDCGGIQPGYVVLALSNDKKKETS
jgi:hypothetical protein